MALRNQPYLPLYVQDFMTDEKLAECTAESTGVYIRMMCLMHKSQEYGTILLQQKDKQNPSTCWNFAAKLARLLPYSFDEIERSLTDLINNDVIQLEDDKISQKRMIRDNIISNKRSASGQKGGFATASAKANNQASAKAKTQANTEYEYENKEVVISSTTKKKRGSNKTFIPPTLEEVKAYCLERKNKVDAKRFLDFYQAANWVDSKGTPVRNWKQKIISAWEENAENSRSATNGKENKYAGFKFVNDIEF